MLAPRAGPGALRHAATCARSLATQAASRLFEPWPDAAAPLEDASSPPPAWNTPAPAAHAAELGAVFWGPGAWLPVARASTVSQPGDRAASTVAGAPTLTVRDGGGTLRAFHNTCRHQAARLEAGCSTSDRITCPYHGWTYGLDGRLTSAPGLGASGFKAREFGLRPLGGGPAAFGPFVWARVGAGPDESFEGWLGGRSARAELADALGLVDDGAPPPPPPADVAGFTHVGAETFPVRANWKVAVANYLDGGYHVPGGHPALAAGLDMGTYTSRLVGGGRGVASLQTVRAAAGGERVGAAADARLASAHGRPAAYAFLYPATMINRYGPWLDANVVVPTGPDSCLVRYDWWVEDGAAAEKRGRGGAATPLAALFATDLAASAAVQAEDTALCEAVQAGSASPGAVPGRYAKREGLLKRFHELVHGDLARAGLV